MKWFSFLMAVGALTAAAHQAGDSSAMTETNEIFYADPTVYTENGKYYLSGTRWGRPEGFALLESSDLLNWHTANPTDSMPIVKGRGSFGDKGFWAPQIIKLDDGSYKLAYTANEQVAIAEAPRLTTLFTQKNIRPVDGSAGNIDPFLLYDNGKWYLYHVRFNNGNFIWVGEYDMENGNIVEGTLSQCLNNDRPWENTDAYPSVPIMEGPTVIKLDGMYYLFYSANHFMSPDYAVGYAVAPSPTGPWTKCDASPIINTKIVGERGSGHGDVFFDNDGNMRYVYHVHNSDEKANPRRTRIITLNVDKSKGHPYTITADPTSIIKPTRK